MKTENYLNGFLIFLAVVFGTGCQQAQSNATEPESTSPQVQATTQVPVAPVKPIEVSADAPEIKIENASIDFGEVGPGSVNKGEYKFSNVGKDTLKIEHVQSTCGCTVPELDKKEYAQGESGVITVTFHAPSVKGDVTKHLYVVSNDPRAPRAELEIKCQVAVKVEVTPEKVDLRFDQPNAGMPELTIKSLDDKEFAIKSITIPNDVMKIAFDPAKKGTSFVLTPQVDVKLLDTYSTGAIQITTDHPQSGALIVRYTALPFIEVNRPRIILQNVEPGETIIKDVLLRSNYEKPIEIASSSSKNGYMEISSQEKDGNHLKLFIKITPPEQTSTARRYITDELKITLKSGEEVTVRCSGWYKL